MRGEKLPGMQEREPARYTAGVCFASASVRTMCMNLKWLHVQKSMRKRAGGSSEPLCICLFHAIKRTQGCRAMAVTPVECVCLSGDFTLLLIFHSLPIAEAWCSLRGLSHTHTHTGTTARSHFLSSILQCPYIVSSDFFILLLLSLSLLRALSLIMCLNHSLSVKHTSLPDNMC